METGIAAIILILVNAYVTYRGLKDHEFLERYSFKIDDILISKDYSRLITSGFLHVNWMHCLFNMMTLYFFSTSLEKEIGAGSFIIIYFASLVGGNLLSLFIHRNHGDYSAVGASGAVSGVVFACIALFPDIKVGMFLLPGILIPGWIYGPLYALISIYGIRSQRDNIGHDAHLGGAVIGMMSAILMYPKTLSTNFIPVLLILIPSSIFIYLILTRPEFLLVDNLFKKRRDKYTLDEEFYTRKQSKEKELDMLLDKISAKGFSSLTEKEKEKLKVFSEDK